MGPPGGPVDSWRIYNGSLYMNFFPAVMDNFFDEEQVAEHIAEADARWTGMLLRVLVRVVAGNRHDRHDRYSFRRSVSLGGTKSLGHRESARLCGSVCNLGLLWLAT